MGSLYALDFDGVICDSCGESSITAVKSAKVRWPELASEIDPETEAWILDNMRVVRPVVETGYENVLLVRLLLEIKKPVLQSTSVVPGLTVEGILENWLQIKPVIMKNWNQNKDALIELFGKIRDEWIQNDLPGWIGENRLYPGISDALQFASSHLYIVTTKQARFAEVLLQELAGVSFPPDRIFGLGSGPKVQVLKELQNRPENSQLELHFVEDRLATLQNVINVPELNKWKLYLGTWGYNTLKEREKAGQISRIRLLDLLDFCTKLK